MVTYKKMSLFDVPEGSYIAHACNSEGIWGRGIAAEIKLRYPQQEPYYKKNANLLGRAVINQYHNEKHTVVNLITSSLDSRNPDKEEEILINTTLALDDLMTNHSRPNTIYSNKFNSGLFKVPWEKTEKILTILSERYKINWVVCDPNLEEK